MPTRFYVQWESASKILAILDRGDAVEDCDPTEMVRSMDAKSLGDARRVVEAMRKRGEIKGWAVIYERRNLRDVTPDGDPVGLLWDWDDAMVEEA